MSDAYNEIIRKLSTLETRIKTSENKIRLIEGTLSICVRKSDLQIESSRLGTDIKNMSSVVTELETKLNKVYLPEDTKYYLDEDELRDLRNKIRQLNAILIRMSSLESTIVQTLNRLEAENNS